MSDQIREQVSAFLDGELPESEAELLLKRLTRDCELRDSFGRYSLMGEALRGSASKVGVTRHFAARVSRRVDPEPAAHIPVRSTAVHRPWWRPVAGIALAAGVAAIAVATWERRADISPDVAAKSLPATSALVAANLASRPASRTAAAREALSYTVPATTTDAPAVLSPARLANYVFAHSQYSSPLGQRNMLSGLLAEQVSSTPPPESVARPNAAASGGP